MEQWHCFKCKEEMQEEDILMEYMEIIRFQLGLKCPKCGTLYLPEDIVIEVVNPGEKQLETKF